RYSAIWVFSVGFWGKDSTASGVRTEGLLLTLLILFCVCIGVVFICAQFATMVGSPHCGFFAVWLKSSMQIFAAWVLVSVKLNFEPFKTLMITGPSCPFSALPLT